MANGRSHLLRVHGSLYEALLLLAATPGEQIDYLERNSPGDTMLPVDELVLMLDDVRDAEIDLAESNVISAEASHAITALWESIEGLTEEPNPWSVDSLANSPAWSRLRASASFAIRKLPPPLDVTLLPQWTYASGST